MLAQAPAFLPFAVMTIVFVLQLVFLWAWSGVVRGRTKTAINSEDAKAFKAELLPEHPPEVQRVLRAHANAMANVIPFWLLAVLFVLEGGGAIFAWAVFGAFTLFRSIYVFAYLGARQPWRTLMFTFGGLTTGVLLVEVIRLLVGRSA